VERRPPNVGHQQERIEPRWRDALVENELGLAHLVDSEAWTFAWSLERCSSSAASLTSMASSEYR